MFIGERDKESTTPWLWLDRNLRLMGDKTIPDSAEPRLESFYPPFVEGIDLPHQGVVDSYNLRNHVYVNTAMTCTHPRLCLLNILFNEDIHGILHTHHRYILYKTTRSLDILQNYDEQE